MDDHELSYIYVNIFQSIASNKYFWVFDGFSYPTFFDLDFKLAEIIDDVSLYATQNISENLTQALQEAVRFDSFSNQKIADGKG